MFVEIQDAREHALSFLSKGKRKMTQYLEELSSKNSTIEELDRSWCLQMKFAEEHAVVLATDRVHNQTMEASPSVDNPLDTDASLKALEVVRTSEVCHLADMVTALGGVAQMVRNLKLDEGPSAFEVASFSMFYKCAVKRMECFFSFDVKKPDEAASSAVFPTVVNKMYGRDALIHKFNEVKAATEKGSKFTLQELQWSKTYAWVFGTEQEQVANKWLKDAAGLKRSSGVALVDAAAGGAAESASASSSSSSAAIVADIPCGPPSRKGKLSAVQQQKADKDKAEQADLMSFFTGEK